MLSYALGAPTHKGRWLGQQHIEHSQLLESGVQPMSLCLSMSSHLHLITAFTWSTQFSDVPGGETHSHQLVKYYFQPWRLKVILLANGRTAIAWLTSLTNMLFKEKKHHFCTLLLSFTSFYILAQHIWKMVKNRKEVSGTKVATSFVSNSQTVTSQSQTPSNSATIMKSHCNEGTQQGCTVELSTLLQCLHLVEQLYILQCLFLNCRDGAAHKKCIH